MVFPNSPHFKLDHVFLPFARKFINFFRQCAYSALLNKMKKSVVKCVWFFKVSMLKQEAKKIITPKRYSTGMI